MTSDTPISDLYMVGDTYAAKLKNNLNIHTIHDLLYHFPFRYDDLSSQKKISDLKVGETVTLSGQILAIQNIRTRNGKQIQKAIFTDGEDNLEITWFNQPYLAKSLKSGTPVNLAGKVSLFGRKTTITSPKYEITNRQNKSELPPQNSNMQFTHAKSASESRGRRPFFRKDSAGLTHTGRLVPVYPETYGVSSKWLRSRIKPIIPKLNSILSDFLPSQILSQEQMFDLNKAIQNIHFPSSWENLEKARERLAFDELFLLQLQNQQTQKDWQQNTLRHNLEVSFEDLSPFIAKLPFALTDDQNKAIHQIIDDLNKGVPMNRLLEGDVGSGKTVVAAAAIYLCFINNLKAILIAPTEVLATQHLKSLEGLLEPHHIKIGFFTGSTKSKDSLDNYDFYLGTHALLFQDFTDQKIALVIIDEQHRFGVEQRAKLIGKKSVPHVLSMTATPIPRTAALTLYGNLSLSLITQMPKGRKQIKTWLVSEKKRQSAYDWIRYQIVKEKSQAFFICPLIDPSEKSMMSELKSVKNEYDRLTKIFTDLSLGLMHGKLKAKDKNQIMQDFADGKIDILVSTSVIEVGIDVPNATMIIIEGAERFGLAQLHQLRGRVGRGEKQSYCLLFSTSGKPEEKTRLKAMETTFSGIELAKLDLKLRGPGQIFGSVQSGFLDLKIASLSDKTLIEKTHSYAQEYLEKLEKFPLLQEQLQSVKIHNIKPN